MNKIVTPPDTKRLKRCENASNNIGRQRIQFIDTAKGFCILLVVMFHAELLDKGTPCLGMLRMPFYFALSGLFFKDYGGFKTILKKINKLLIPFLFFYIISYLFFIGIRISIGGVIDIPFFSFVNSKEMVNIALWFLLALFWSNVFFLIIYKVSKNRYILGLLSAVVGVGSMICFNYYGITLPLYIDSGIVALPFFYLGYMLKSSNILYPNSYDKYNILVIMMLIFVAVLCFYSGDKPYIGFGSLDFEGNPALFYIGAVSIVIAFILICKKAGPIFGLRYIGRYSLIILGVHLTIISTASNGFRLLGIDQEASYFSFMVFFLSIIVSSALIPILIKLFPKFTAQEDLITEGSIQKLFRAAQSARV